MEEVFHLTKPLSHLVLPLSILEVLVASWRLGAAGRAHGTFLAVPAAIGDSPQTHAVNVVAVGDEGTVTHPNTQSNNDLKHSPLSSTLL